MRGNRYLNLHSLDFGYVMKRLEDCILGTNLQLGFASGQTKKSIVLLCIITGENWERLVTPFVAILRNFQCLESRTESKKNT